MQTPLLFQLSLLLFLFLLVVVPSELEPGGRDPAQARGLQHPLSKFVLQSAHFDCMDSKYLATFEIRKLTSGESCPLPLIAPKIGPQMGISKVPCIGAAPLRSTITT